MCRLVAYNEMAMPGVPRLSIFYGPDDFSRREALEALRASLGPRDEVDANTTWLSGAELSGEQLQAVCATVPFLAPKRLVVVEGLLGRFQQRVPSRRGGRAAQRSASLGVWQSLPEMVSAFPETTVLVLLDGDLSPTNPLLQALAPIAQVQEFPVLSGEALRRWVQQRVVNKGGRLTPAALRLLIELVGSNLWALDSELEKLVLFASSREVAEEDVRTLVARAREVNVFSAVDAVLEGRSTAAVMLLHQLLADGAPVPYLLSMLARQTRLLLLTKALVDRGVPPRELGQRLGGVTDFVVRKCLEQARRTSPETLRYFHHRILEADLAIKLGQMRDELSLELLVADLAGHRQGSALTR